MLSYSQTALLGFLQGLTELFPVSSLGHSILLPSLLGWRVDESSPQFVAFIVLTHLATALVLLGFFWKDWMNITGGIFRSLYRREISEKDPYGKLGWLIIVSTVPVGILGLLFQEQVSRLFAAPRLVAGALFLNGILLYSAEKLRAKLPEEKADDTTLAKLTWKQAVGIGLAECLALIPGFSRTGLTMTGGLLSSLSHENAARYAFLLATPVIFAASVLKIPDLFGSGGIFLGPAAWGAAWSAIAAYFSVRFLTKYFESKKLTPFAFYCIVAAGLCLAALA
ncbi:MAG: undecaprenyl-diphosphate phosphatase [Patescibacteria group bacterium]|nr:undecaprenyl-diphosphate phosphatase [Patescibacteria group bacterium]